MTVTLQDEVDSLFAPGIMQVETDPDDHIFGFTFCVSQEWLHENKGYIAGKLREIVENECIKVSRA